MQARDKKGRNWASGSRNVRALTVFLAVMTLLTQTALAADSLLVPRASVCGPEEKKLEYHMEIQGQIQAEQEQAVYCQENLRVKDVPVQEGAQVKKGDLLFAVEEKSLDLRIRELEREIQKLDLQIEDLEQAYRQQTAQKEREYQRASQDYSDIVNQTQNQLDQASLELEQAERELQQQEGGMLSGIESEEPKEEAEETSSAERMLSEIESEESKEGETEIWQQRQEKLFQQYQEKKKAYEEALAAREEAVKDAARQLEDAEEKLPKDHSADLLRIDRQELEESLKGFCELRQAKGKVYAEADGQVKTVGISVGGITGSEPAMLLYDFGQSFRFEGSAQEDENFKVEEGMEGILEAEGGKVKLEGIKISSAAAEEGVCRVTAVLDSTQIQQPQDAALSLVKKSRWYERVLPLSALHHGEQEDYVIRVQEKATILGIENVAEYVPVILLEKNREYAAVKGEIFKEDQIVSDADKNIKEGERIRIVEE